MMKLLNKYLFKKQISGSEEAAGCAPEQAETVEASEASEVQKLNLKERFPYLDTDYGMSLCMDKEDFYIKMMEIYVEEEQVDVLKKDYEKKDWKTYEVHVHGMKNTAATIGAMEMSELFKNLEFASKDYEHPDLPYINAHHDEMIQKYEELLSNLRNDLSEIAACH